MTKRSLKEFNKLFEREYSFLYDHDDITRKIQCNYSRKFSEMMCNGTITELVQQLVDYRQDLIRSDRETAAFVLAMEAFYQY